MRDHVDELVAQWSVVDPGLDTDPVRVVNRLLRLGPRIERHLDEAMSAHGLTLPEFSLLSVLRRRGGSVPQRDLAPLLDLTPATVSVRVDALEAQGLVARRRAGTGRGFAVELTGDGSSRLGDAVATHLAAEEEVLAPLGDDQRRTIAALLRRLTLETAWDGRRRLACGAVVADRRSTSASFDAVGLAAPPGLLVLEAQGPAAAAGLAMGDVLASVDGCTVLGVADLEPLDHAEGAVDVTVTRGAEGGARDLVIELLVDKFDI